MIFSVSTVGLINLLLIAAGIGVCGLCLLQITGSNHLRIELRRSFQVFFAFIILYISAHMARELMDGLKGDGVRFALYAVTFTEMFAAALMAYQMSVLVLTVSIPDRRCKPLHLTYFLILCAHAALMVADRFCNIIYYFDNSNVYHRGSVYLLSNLAPIAMLIIDMILLVKYRKNIDKTVKLAFWVYMIAPLFAAVVQIAFYGVQFIIFATVGAAVYMFAVIVQNQNEEYEKQRLENTRIETELNMASIRVFSSRCFSYSSFWF